MLENNNLEKKVITLTGLFKVLAHRKPQVTLNLALRKIYGVDNHIFYYKGKDIKEK